MSYATKAAAEGGSALTRVLLGGAVASLATMSLAFSTIAFTSYRSAMEQRDEILAERAISKAAEEEAAKNSSTTAAEWVTALQQSSSNTTGGSSRKTARGKASDAGAKSQGGEDAPEDADAAGKASEDADEKQEGEGTEDGGKSAKEDKKEKSGQSAASDGTEEEGGDASQETGENGAEKAEGTDASAGANSSSGNPQVESAGGQDAETGSELAPPNGAAASNPATQGGMSGIPAAPNAGQYSTNAGGSPAASDNSQSSSSAASQTPAQLNPDAQRSAPAGGSAPAQVSDAAQPNASAQQGTPAQQDVPSQPSSPAQPETPEPEAYPGQNSEGGSDDAIEPFQEYGQPKKEAVESGNGSILEESAGSSASGEIGPGIGMSQVNETELDSIASEGMQQHYADTTSENASSESGRTATTTAASAEASGASGSSDPFANYYAPTVFNDYNVLLDTAMGPMLYYNQHDSHWASYKYGGTDPMTSYGCGPTATAMVVNAFGNIQGAITPKEMADWSSSYGYFAPQKGSYHNYIPAVLSAFDLLVDTVQDRSVENVSQLLREGHILVALMGQGSLTKGGHFIVITRLNDDGTVNIADPNSYKNSTKKWDLDKILDELKDAYDGGGPLWSVQQGA